MVGDLVGRTCVNMLWHDETWKEPLKVPNVDCCPIEQGSKLLIGSFQDQGCRPNPKA